MSDELNNEIKHALAGLSDAELATFCRYIPSTWSRAQDSLRHNQYLVQVPNTPSEPLIAINGVCVITGEAWGTDAYPKELLFRGLCLWSAGSPAQDALRFMSASERKFLMSGISSNGGGEIMNQEEPGDREPFFPAPNPASKEDDFYLGEL